MEELGPKSNVIILPQTISKGKKEILEKDITVDEAKNMAIDKILEMKDTSESVFAMVIDKKTGVPTVIMGGYTDPTYVMAFVELVKDELKQIFRTSTEFFSPDDDSDEFSGV